MCVCPCLTFHISYTDIREKIINKMDQNEIGWADPQQFLTKLVEEM